ncbi:MAG: Omp28-related outer membrane protein [Prevotellaceae bacterium]|jgi:hypothetical protein|nr:Omp28-related outer membrane protein [Prevotellaceae bacterium]
MKIKSIFHSLIAAGLVLTACNPEPPNPPASDTDISIAVAWCGNSIDDVASLNTGASAPWSGAIEIPDTMIADKGTQILAIRVGISDPEATNCEVFITTDLEGTPIYKQSFTPKGNGWEYVALNTPVDIPKGEKIFVGYNATMKSFAYTNLKKASRMADWYAIDGKWAHLSTSFPKTGVSVQAFVIGGDYGDKLPYDVQISDLQYADYLELGEENIISGIVTNYGVKKLSGITISYSDGTQTDSVTIDQTFANGENARFSLPNITYSSAQDITFTLTAKPVYVSNSTANNQASGNQIFFGTAFPRTLLFEEFTGVDCVYCPEGAAAMKAAAHDSIKRVAIVAHHVGYAEDIYTIEKSRSYRERFVVNGAPSMMIDRRIIPSLDKNTPVIHPGYTTPALVKQLLKIPSFVTVDLSATTYDADNRKLTVEVSGEFVKAYPNAKLNVFLVQDSIIGAQKSTSGTIPDYVHMFTIREILTPIWGDDIPNSIGTYTKSYTYTIPESITGPESTTVKKPKAIPCEPKNMYIVAFIADNSTNFKQCEVHNAAYKRLIE